MDFLQIALIFLIMLLAVFLSVLGIQVFFILKDLKTSLDKLDKILDETTPVEKVVNSVVVTGAKEVKKAINPKPPRRLFRRH